jgi:hypothetical protein
MPAGAMTRRTSPNHTDESGIAPCPGRDGVTAGSAQNCPEGLTGIWAVTESLDS